VIENSNRGRRREKMKESKERLGKGKRNKAPPTLSS
jgi:hypothetical protein